jgi:excinuclease UvrABC ATPase subunit
VLLSIPQRITVFVGVSGSGKSSIVFDTIAVEAQHQLNATFPPFIQNQLPKHEQPHVDAIESLTTPVVDQRPLTGNARSTVGTITDIYAMIRVPRKLQTILFKKKGRTEAGARAHRPASGPSCEGGCGGLVVDRSGLVRV